MLLLGLHGLARVVSSEAWMMAECESLLLSLRLEASCFTVCKCMGLG